MRLAKATQGNPIIGSSTRKPWQQPYQEARQDDHASLPTPGFMCHCILNFKESFSTSCLQHPSDWEKLRYHNYLKIRKVKSKRPCLLLQQKSCCSVQQKKILKHHLLLFLWKRWAPTTFKKTRLSTNSALLPNMVLDPAKLLLLL